MTGAAADAPILSAEDFERLLDVTRLIATPLALPELLATVTQAACQLLHAERCSVWMHDEAAGELVLEVATDVQSVRLPLGTGLVGQCATERSLINVPDCYADPRFDRSVDLRTGFRTRCSLTLPLLDHQGALVGVMQLLNRAEGSFSHAHERLAQALAAQCAVALQRARMTAALIAGELARQELEVARGVQMGTLPASMPVLAGYSCHGLALPAAQTGGDTFDLASTAHGLLIVLADATGHGLGPALSVTQMHAMLRMALRLDAPLQQAVLQLNNLLAETLAEDRFITAFIGLLDPATHTLRFISAGQSPILHLHAGDGRISALRPTSFPLGAMALAAAPRVHEMALAPGDLLAVLSDGFFEQLDAGGEEFGVRRAEALLQEHRLAATEVMSRHLVQAVQAFAGDVPQADDMSLVLLRRDPEPCVAQRAFPRQADSLQAVFDFGATFCAEHRLPDGLRLKLDFVLEELFTNLVKYSAGAAPVDIGLRWEAAAATGTGAPAGRLWCQIDDADGRPFDPRQAPDVDVTLPAEQRQPGGLGLHLIRRMVETLDYQPLAVPGDAAAETAPAGRRTLFSLRPPAPRVEGDS